MSTANQAPKFDAAAQREIRQLAMQVVHAYVIGFVLLSVAAGAVTYVMRDQIKAAAKRSLLDSVRPNPADLLPNDRRKIPWLRETGQAFED